MINLKLKNYNWIFILLIVFVYWQISFCTAALKWDLLDVVFPFRYHFSSAASAGHFPLWNPYIQTGVPYYADLQAPTYYPELLVVSSLGGYTIYWMHFLIIVYFIVAFLGLFKLLTYFQYSNWTSSLAAFIYVCSGYFVGHGQHFFLLVGSAWLPWVIWAYLKFIDKRNQRTALIFVLSTFLMLTGGYQALSICLFYLLLLFFLIQSYRLVKESIKELIPFLFWHVGVVLILIILLSPMLLAIFEISPQVIRLAEGVNWDKTASYGLSFKSLISFFSPLSVARSNSFFGSSDASMLNHFLGVCGLFFGLYGLKSKRHGREWLLLAVGLLIGAMSFADLPIRKLLFDYVPFMNLFLQGAYLRVFMILGLVVFISGGMEKWHTEQSFSLKQTLIPFLVLSLAISIIAIRWASFDFTKFFDTWLHPSNWLDGWKQIDFNDLLGFQLILCFLFLCLMLFILARSTKLKHPKLLLTSLVVFELLLASLWNQSETVVDKNIKPSFLHKNIQLTPKGFPIPHLTPIGYNDEQHAFSLPFWRNTSIFQKEISYNAFSSFELNNYSFIDDKAPKLKEWVLQHPLVYLADTVLPFSNWIEAVNDDKLKHSSVFVESSAFKKLMNLKLNADSSDQLKITGFSPNGLCIRTQTKNQQLLILHQSFQPEWKAIIDGKETQIIKVNANYQAVVLPKGLHKIEFSFEKNAIRVLYLVSQFLFWFLLIYLIYLSLNENRKSNWIFKLLFIFPLLFIGFWAVKFYSGKMNMLPINQQILADWSTRSVLKKRVSLPEKITISKKDEFQNLGKWKFNELNNASTLRVQTACKMDTILPTLLVYQIMRNGESVKWEAMKLERQMERTGKFNQLLFMRNLSDVQKEDEVILYYWNFSKATIVLKDTKLEFLN
jgi:hypothetical protein